MFILPQLKIFFKNGSSHVVAVRNIMLYKYKVKSYLYPCESDWGGWGVGHRKSYLSYLAGEGCLPCPAIYIYICTFLGAPSQAEASGTLGTLTYSQSTDPSSWAHQWCEMYSTPPLLFQRVKQFTISNSFPRTPSTTARPPSSPGSQ